jgi:hypothetical protein
VPIKFIKQHLLHKDKQQQHLFQGCGIFVFFGFLTWFSLVMLIQTGIASNNTLDYGDLARKACGKKGQVSE